MTVHFKFWHWNDLKKHYFLNFSFNNKPFSAIFCNDIIACLFLIFRWKRIEPSSSSWLATLLSRSRKVTRLTSEQSPPAELFWAWSWVTTATWVTNNSVPPSKTSRGSSQTISVAILYKCRKCTFVKCPLSKHSIWKSEFIICEMWNAFNIDESLVCPFVMSDSKDAQK